MPQREPSFGPLLIVLICFLLVGPVATHMFGRADGVVLLISLNLILVVGIFSLQENKKLFIAGLTIAALSISNTILNLFVGSDILALSGVTLLLGFLIMSVAVAFRHLIGPGGISFNRVMGGACVYLMLGIIWAVLYTYVDATVPGAFSGALDSNNGDILRDENRSSFWDLVYFSFVTMPALGYGDITPVSPLARGLAYMQAVIGQLYIAILIGSLVGAYISDRSRQQN